MERFPVLSKIWRAVSLLLQYVVEALGVSSFQQAWTLILWNQADVPVPDQLKGPDGLKKLYDLLLREFATSRHRCLHCMKIASCWSSNTSSANQLGALITLSNVEALTIAQHARESRAASGDKLLMQAAQRFMQLLTHKNSKQPLIVFITSDAEICSTLKELRQQKCKIAILYHKPNCSAVPDHINNNADEAYWWLSFVRQGLQMPRLRIKPIRGVSNAAAEQDTPEQSVLPWDEQLEQSICPKDDGVQSLNDCKHDLIKGLIGSNRKPFQQLTLPGGKAIKEVMHSEQETVDFPPESAVQSWLYSAFDHHQLYAMHEQQLPHLLHSSTNGATAPQDNDCQGKHFCNAKETISAMIPTHSSKQGLAHQMQQQRSKQAATQYVLDNITRADAEWAKLEKLLQSLLHIGHQHRRDVFRLAKQVCTAAMAAIAFHDIFTDLCYHLNARLPDFEADKVQDRVHFSSFRKGLYSSCKTELAKATAAREAFNVSVAGCDHTQTLNSNFTMAQQQFLSSIKFMTHLYNRKLVTDALMHQCVSYLLNPQHAKHEELQCLCELMRTVGRELDSHPNAKERMTAYFERIHYMMTHASLSSQTCCMLQDLYQLRESSWIPYHMNAAHHKSAANVARKLFV